MMTSAEDQFVDTTVVSDSPAVIAAKTLLDSLWEQGLRHIVLSPGSRSAPLAYAAFGLARSGKVTLHTRIDERVAAFTALGLGFALGMSPVAAAAVVTTSGTAVANLHPAVLEAHHSGIPLLVLTADRPAELRDTGANQTTDQVNIFGSATRLAIDVPAPTLSDLGTGSGQRYWRDLGARAMAAATGIDGGTAGPVQLNLAYRDPLVPSVKSDPKTSIVAQETATSAPLHIRISAPRVHDAHLIPRGPRTVIVAGDKAGPDARELAASTGWPVLAEPSSGCRGGEYAISAYRLLLEADELHQNIERVIVFGHPTLSRQVSVLLAREDVETIVVSDNPRWTDPARNADLVVAAVTVVGDVVPGEKEWLSNWRQGERAARTEITRVIDSTGLSGLHIAHLMAQAQRPGDVLFVGSSSAIRDLDLVEGLAGVLVLANRGLAGIDGTISAATGVGLSYHGVHADSGENVESSRLTVYVGDLTFLHDAGALLIGPGNTVPDMRIVVVNDFGGAIFHTLEPGDSAREDAFERIFATPQHANIEAIARGYGVNYRRAATAGELSEILHSAPQGRELVEIVVDRTRRRATEQQLKDSVAIKIRMEK